MMTDIQIKLSELISPQDINSKRRGSLYTLNNSLKRNTLYPITLSKNQDLGYDCKLPRMSLKRKDLAKILEIILSKEEMSLPDRNLLRRILVDIFDEELICSGSRNFISHLKLLQYRSHETKINPRQKLYYFVLKGAAVVKSGGFTYKVTEGETFGHMELLSNENIESVTYIKHTLMVTLSQIHFDSYFRYYYQIQYEQKRSHISCIQQRYLHQIPTINQYFLLNNLQFETFNLGDKIIEAGKPVACIYFVGNNWKGDMQSNFLEGTFGLKQIMKDKDQYIESAYSLDFGYKVPYVQKDIFVKYVKDYLNFSNFKARTAIHTRAMVRNTQADQTVAKLMSMKRVKFQSKTKKKMRTEPFESIISDFKFFRPFKQVLFTPKKSAALSFSNQNIANLMFSNRKSQSIQLKTIQKSLF